MNNPIEKPIQSPWPIEKQFEYAVVVTTLFQDILGKGAYKEVPDCYKIDFAGTKKQNPRTNKLEFISQANRWILTKTRTSKRNSYVPAEIARGRTYTIIIDHPLAIGWMNAQIGLYYKTAGDEPYTSCRVGVEELTGLCRAWMYDGHHLDYAKRAIEGIFTAHIAHQWHRRQQTKTTRLLIGGER